MKMRHANRKNKGVSTIVAAALLVAMTVILGVALGATVLNAPETEKPYQLTLDGTASINAGEIRVTHLGGDPISISAVAMYTFIPESSSTYSGSRAEIPATAIISQPSSGALQAGDTIVFDFRTSFAESGLYPGMGFYYTPSVGEQFIVEFYYNAQPITAVTIIVQP